MAVACVLVAGGIALAQGPDMNLPVFGITPGSLSSYAPVNDGYGRSARFEGDEEAAPEAKPKRGARASFGYGNPVCVRLCDGSFFPTASVSGGEAACASQCPDAPTALYTMPTDRIEDAISSAGVPYSKLPVAKRYQTTFNNACTCHRGTVAASAASDLLNDSTLRKGDVVMTGEGFRVYEGGGYGPSSPRDFVALSKASLSKSQRASLAEMERASSGSPRLASPDRVVARPLLRGNVTVDNGAPSPSR
jgi:Protein of unknown function (DUF2865)